MIGGMAKDGNRRLIDQERWPLLIAMVAIPLGAAWALWWTSVSFGEADFPVSPRELESPATIGELATVLFTEVEGQMRVGTGGQLNRILASWSSQPGAIRHFSATDSVGEILKLYSAAEMQVPGGTDLSADVPPNWDTQPDHFADLNVPSLGDGGALEFPIADPRAFTGDAEGAEGFSYESSINGVVRPDPALANHDAQRLPMPVRWRYVLKRGETGTLDDQNRWTGEGTPSVHNPIVGRIAYWTDDLSSRINVNTAAEGVYWDTPRADTVEERAYATHQPARVEFQRHPGHPAMTCLSSVLFPNRRYYLPGTNADPNSLTLAEVEQLWLIAPGIGTGGSKGGTRRIAEDEPAVVAEPASYHLYASLDDVVDSNPALPPAVAQRVRWGEFLLTTESNAPETSALGTPRIAMWPVPVLVEGRSEFDQKIAAVATLGGAEYFYQREFEENLFSDFYVAGGGNNVSLSYFLSEASPFPFPGYPNAGIFGGGLFEDWSQITVGINGYIRGANLSDPTVPQPFTPEGNVAGHGQVTALVASGGVSVHQNRWYKKFSPYPIGGARSYSISEVALVFVVSGFVDDDGNTFGDSESLSAGQSRFEVGLVFETFSAAHGFTQIVPKARLDVTNSVKSGGGIDADPIPLRLNGVDYQLNQVQSIANTDADLGGSGGATRFTNSLNQGGDAVGWTRNRNPEETFIVPGDTLTIESIGGTGFGWDLIVQEGDFSQSHPNRIWQFLPIRRPFGSEPLQIPAPLPTVDRSKIGTWSERLEAAGSDPQALIQEGDVVRSFVIRHGDSRLIESKLYGGASSRYLFVEHPNFADTSERMAHSLVDSKGAPLFGAKFGRALVDGALYPSSVRPDFAVSPTSPDYLTTPQFRPDDNPAPDPSVTGDFDTGVGGSPDGPYTNHADPGVYFTDGVPYFDHLNDVTRSNATVFSPQRIMPGPGMMGSLPTGVQSGVPWRTLLFRPDPQHFGGSGLPDHVLLDQFWMPVPEPHGISHDYSTDGKINLNYAIAPFSHIRRATALHALFKAEKMMAIPVGAAPVYKTETSTESWRHHIDTEETLQQFEARFEGGGFFRSSSEICEQYLVPEGETLGDNVDGDYPDMRAFWAEHRLTGDNVKERPYTNLQTRLTTKSNAFKIYAIVQPITKAPESDQAVFDPTADTLHEATPISATLRRLLDGTRNCQPSTIPNYLRGSIETLPSVDEFYRYSIVNTQPNLRPLSAITEVVRSTSGEVTLRWPSRSQDVFIVERSTDLSGSWEVIDPNFGGSSQQSEFVDPAPPAGTRAYYRARCR